MLIMETGDLRTTVRNQLPIVLKQSENAKAQ
jgi:hypothetical protein